MRETSVGRPGAPTRSAGSRGNGCLVAVVSCLVLAALVALAAWWELTIPTVSQRAQDLEEVLRTLPVGDAAAAGLHLVDQGSTPGERASGFAADNPTDPSVWRTYRHTGDITAVCAAVKAQLVSAGWRPAGLFEDCSTNSPEASRVTLTRNCTGFSADAEVRVYGPTVSYADPNSATIRISTPYPDTPERPDRVDPVPVRGEPVTSTSTLRC